MSLPQEIRVALPPFVDPAAFIDLDASRPIIDLVGETMGTSWGVRLVAPRKFDRAEIRAAISVRLDAINDQMSHWAPSSSLCAFNRAEAGSSLILPQDFAIVIEAALAVARASGGAFDPTIGKLVDLWGFGPPGPVAAAPAAAAIEAARHSSGWQRLDHAPSTRRLGQPGGVALDLSGIAKGYAVDAIADLLAVQGIAHCLIEIGGELTGRGIRPDGHPWWVDLENPPGIDLPPVRIALHGMSVATSGNYLSGDHEIDPRTGRPIVNGICSVSVLHASAMLADAWATALSVMGPVDGMAIAAEHDLAARFVMADGRELITAPLAGMISPG